MTATDTFIVRKAEIDELLAKLVTLSEEHFNVDAERVNWADVGSLGFIQARLEEIAQFANAA